MTPSAGRRMFGCGALMTLAALAMTGLPVSSKAESGSNRTGSWSGGGWVAFASGTKESACCRAYYSRAGGTSYRLSATYATASAKPPRQQSCSRLAQITSRAASTIPNTMFRERSVLWSRATARA